MDGPSPRGSGEPEAPASVAAVLAGLVFSLALSAAAISILVTSDGGEAGAGAAGAARAVLSATPTPSLVAAQTVPARGAFIYIAGNQDRLDMFRLALDGEQLVRAATGEAQRTADAVLAADALSPDELARELSEDPNRPPDAPDLTVVVLR